MLGFLFKSKVKKEEQVSNSFLVIRCELVADSISDLKENVKYLIAELNFYCEYVGVSDTDKNIHFLKIKGTKSFPSISGSNLYNLLLGRLIENSKGEPVATIYKFVNVVSVME